MRSVGGPNDIQLAFSRVLGEVPELSAEAQSSPDVSLWQTEHELVKKSSKIVPSGARNGAAMRLILIAGILLGTLSFTIQESKKMTAKPTNRQMDYIEFPATDISTTKNFYSNVFRWKFTDYGPAA